MKKLFYKSVTLAVFTLLLSTVTYAQEYKLVRETVQKEVISYKDVRTDKNQEIKFFFEIDSYTMNENFSTNSQTIAKLDKIFNGKDVEIGLDSLVILAVSSIDGLEENNATLSKNRAEAVAAFMRARYPHVKFDTLKVNSIAEDWDGLRAAIESDSDVPYQSEILEIIDNPERTADNKEWAIKTIYDRKPWRYIRDNILPQQRYGASVVFYYNTSKQKEVTYTDVVEVVDSVLIEKTAPIVEPTTPEPRYIALKTNLLYDVLAMPNIEVEILIGDRWSVGAEFIFANWENTGKEYTQNIQFGNLSATYWLGDRERYSVLTGWNVGAFVGYGNYDYQIFDKDGKQGEGVINAGLSVGYAHAINKKKNLHLHYQVGAGYQNGEYWDYTQIDGTKYGDVPVVGEPWQKKTRNSFGLLQAEVSLVWMINIGNKKK